MDTQNLLTDLTPEQEENVNGGGIFSWLGRTFKRLIDGGIKIPLIPLIDLFF